MHRDLGQSIANARKNMTDAPKTLEDIRAEIDRLDRAMHDNLMARTALVAEIGTAKGAAPRLRPAREMEILRALAARHEGALPLPALLHIFREVMAASLAMQAPFSVFLPGGEDALGYWDLARFHFGALTKLTQAQSASHIVQEVADTPGAVGIVPDILFEEDAPWWKHLLAAGEGGPRVAARLPYIDEMANASFPHAFMIAVTTQRATGDDASLIAVLADAETGRAQVAKALTDADISARLLSLAADRGGTDRRYFLFETDDFVAEGDPRLAKAQAADGIFQLDVIGGYARPLGAKGMSDG